MRIQIGNMLAGSVVGLQMREGKSLVTPRRPATPKLGDLLKKVSKCNLHAASDTGDAVGKEVW